MTSQATQRVTEFLRQWEIGKGDLILEVSTDPNTYTASLFASDLRLILATIREAINLGIEGESIAGIDLLLERFPELADAA